MIEKKTSLSKLNYLWKIPVSLLCIVISFTIITNISLMYDFAEPEPFSGDQIYNPYQNFTGTWKKATFHVHTRVDSFRNECELYPDSTIALYKSYEYDIVGLSNHMELTEYPEECEPKILEYEHGFNAINLHNLVFNPDRVKHLDGLLPLTVSQKQFKFDRLNRNSDFIVFNHPQRTRYLKDAELQKLSGYRLIEADSKFWIPDTLCVKWDIVLSAGHYIPSAIGDDFHHPYRHERFAMRFNYLGIENIQYKNIKEALLSGNFYSMSIPDFGDGNLEIKHAPHRNLPQITSIGLTEDEIKMKLSEKASRIEVVGQNGNILKRVSESDSVSYRMKTDDSYARLVAKFDNGCIIMSNPFARWDGGVSGATTPYKDTSHPVNWILTILWNLAIVTLSVGLSFLGVIILKRK